MPLAITELPNTTDQVKKDKLLEVKEARNTETKLHTRNALPLELLHHIFQLLIWIDSESVITILALSQYWYHIAWNTPQFWDTLVLGCKPHKWRTNLWIARSKGHISELYIENDLPFPYEDRLLKAEPSELLKQFRWDTLRLLDITIWESYQTFDGLAKTAEAKTAEDDSATCVFPSLETVVLREGSRLRRTNAAPFPLRSLANYALPKLSHFTIKHSDNPWRYFFPHFGLTSIHFIKCYVPWSNHYLAPFEANKGLRSLIIDSVYPEYQDQPGPRKTSFSSDVSLYFEKLEHLKLDSSQASELFEILTAPALQFLSLKGSNNIDSRLKLLFTSSHSTHLTQLHLDDCKVTKGVLVDLVKHSPLLTDLELIKMEEQANAVLDTLVASSLSEDPLGSEIFCPSLTRIGISSVQYQVRDHLIPLIKARNLVNSLHGVDSVSHLPVQDRPQRCVQISHLTIYQFEDDSQNWLSWLKENVPNLTYIEWRRPRIQIP